jgi:hypothetical protein
MSGLGAMVEQVKSGVERLGRRDELTAQLRRIDAVDRASAQLAQELQQLTATMAVARAAGFAPQLPDARGASVGVDTLRGQLGNGDVDREFAQGVIDLVRSLIREANESLTIAWRAYVEDRIPSPEGLLVLAEAFNTVEGASDYARRLRTAILSVNASLQQAPSADAIAKVNELAAEIPRLLQQLVGAEPDVRAFAEQLARGGAAMDALTPSVLKWMKDSGFASSFKVVAGRPAGT